MLYPCRRRRKKLKKEGLLYAIGGAADKTLSRFVELSGGKDASILILPHSSFDPRGAAEELAGSFASLGAGKVSWILPGEEKELDFACSSVFLSGGDQNRFMQLAGEKLLRQIRHYVASGGILGGTSAGAALLAPRMIAGGMSDGMPRGGSLLIADGIGLLPGYLVDTHVGARSRQDRLMAGLALVEGACGLGLDEDTAAEISGGRVLVHGSGLVHHYKRAEDFHSDLGRTSPSEAAAVCNVKYSIFPAGSSFEL